MNQVRVPDGSSVAFKDYKNILTKSDTPDSKGVIEISSPFAAKVSLRMTPIESGWNEPLKPWIMSLPPIGGGEFLDG